MILFVLAVLVFVTELVVVRELAAFHLVAETRILDRSR